MKKKTVWAEIVKEFEIKGYNVTEEILDRKMRNIKHTYKSIKDNNKKTSTGRGRISWEWYDIMENIFKEDRTINIGPTLASMVSESAQINNVESITDVSPHLSITNDVDQITNCSETELGENVRDDEASWCVRDFENNFFLKTVVEVNNLDSLAKTFLHSSINFYVFNWLKKCAEFNFCSYMYDMENEDTRYKYDQFINNHVTNKHKLFDFYSQTVSSVATNSSVPDTVLNDISNRKSKKQKSTRAKASYELRKKQLECEERRVNAIDELKEAIKEHNAIQRERNEILQQLIQSNRMSQ